MTFGERATAIEKSCKDLHYMTRQQWRTPEDHRQELQHLKSQLSAGERELQSRTEPDDGQQGKLIFWLEFGRGTIRERGEVQAS